MPGTPRHPHPNEMDLVFLLAKVRDMQTSGPTFHELMRMLTFPSDHPLSPARVERSTTGESDLAIALFHLHRSELECREIIR